MAFSSIFKSLNANFCTWRGTVIIEKAQGGQRGTFMPQWGIYPVTFGPLWRRRNREIVPVNLSHCPCMKGHSQGRWKHIFFVEEKGIFLNFKSLNANVCPWRATVKCKGAPLYLNGAFILSHLGPYGDDGTGKLSPWTFLIAPEGAQSRAVKAHFLLRRRAFSSILSPQMQIFAPDGAQ